MGTRGCALNEEGKGFDSCIDSYPEALGMELWNLGYEGALKFIEEERKKDFIYAVESIAEVVSGPYSWVYIIYPEGISVQSAVRFYDEVEEGEFGQTPLKSLQFEGYYEVGFYHFGGEEPDWEKVRKIGEPLYNMEYIDTPDGKGAWVQCPLP